MPTFYLLRSGHLERRGIRFEEFSVPSGNLTMQQMVARQVDLGTYAAQSFPPGPRQGQAGGHRPDRAGGKEKKIAAILDWSQALRPQFMERARA